MTGPATADPLLQTRRWLERVVIGLGLCPFAAAPFNAGRIAYRVSDAQSLDDIHQVFLTQLYELLTSTPQNQETGLLILSRGLRGFDAYLDALAMLEQAVAEAGAEGLVQIPALHVGQVEGQPSRAHILDPLELRQLALERPRAGIAA